MRIRWRNFELPTRVVREHVEGTDPERYGKFIAAPFQRGYGATIGNGLRRVLLSSIEGSAVTSLRIHGIQHEFSSLPGMLEDITDVVINVKRLRVRLHGEGPVALKIRKKGPGEVTGADVQCDHQTEVVNPELHIATLTENSDFDAELLIRHGRGYVTADEGQEGEPEPGVIPLDAIYSPVYRVKYAIENTRVGEITNYDKLILEIWTDGTVSPEMALVEASKIYRKHLNPFVQYFEDREASLVADEIKVAEQLAVRGAASTNLEVQLQMPIAELHLSSRAASMLDAEGIRTIGDLVRRSEPELAALKGFKGSTLTEITKKLAEVGLSLGMAVSNT
ncbi:MAG: DNA-directed RNA polymerase subunit alpha [Planctomycetes bacterium]|nr:DNA-directed RNA polymerase subunit alpha [Planctomycetota bacterium]